MKVWPLLAVALCVAANAQVLAPASRRAVAISGLAPIAVPPTPQNIGGGLRYYWNYNDLTVGVTVSNQWNDRIQNTPAYQMDTAKSPTNSALGVRFNGAQWLTNISFTTLPPGNNTGTVFIIMSPETTASSAGAILASSDSGGRGLYGTSSHTLRYFGGVNSPTICTYVSGTLMDFVMTATNNFAAVPTNVYYTNSVACLTNATGFVDQLRIGADNEPSPVFIKGTIRELAYYSNVLTSIQISKLHYYRTNTYGGSP